MVGDWTRRGAVVEMAKVSGTVKRVSKYDGIKLAEHSSTWYNPRGNVQQKITKDLLGRKVTLSLKQGETYAFDDMDVLGDDGE